MFGGAFGERRKLEREVGRWKEREKKVRKRDRRGKGRFESDSDVNERNRSKGEESFPLKEKSTLLIP